MATLEDLAGRGATRGLPNDREPRRKIVLRTPQELYELWERQQWQSHGIDFARDREEWPQLTGAQKDCLVWLLSSFFVAEERVTTQLSGLLMAYGDEAEESFLATQQADEARHMQFFDRFCREVARLDVDDFRGRLRRVRNEVSDAFMKLFDESLVQASKRLIEDPSDLGAKLDFVTTYHMVIEGTLGVTAQHWVTRYLEGQGILPGFLEGFRYLARDEHRHVAYGTWFLDEALAADEALVERVQAKLRELLPIATQALVPPGPNRTAGWRAFGYRSDRIVAFALNALSRRLNAIGLPFDVASASTPAAA